MRYITHVACAAAVLLAGVLGEAVRTHHGDAGVRRGDDRTVIDVYCPEEDSCKIDYDGKLDRWIVSRDPLH